MTHHLSSGSTATPGGWLIDEVADYESLEGYRASQIDVHFVRLLAFAPDHKPVRLIERRVLYAPRSCRRGLLGQRNILPITSTSGKKSSNRMYR